VPLDIVRRPAVQIRGVPNDTRIDIRLPEEERQMFFDAAKADGLPLSLWLRRIARREAAKLLERAAPRKRNNGRG